jgi:hypothetical protein
MEPMKLSFGALIAYLNRAIAQMEDPRQASNGRKYSLKDAVLAAFSAFFMQSESFLDFSILILTRCIVSNVRVEPTKMAL